MALEKKHVFKVSTAYYFFAPGKTMTTAPAKADLGDITKIETAGYVHIGHTSIEQALEVETEGGEVETDGTLQDPTLFTNISASSKSFLIKVQEWNTENMKLALGANAVVRADGSLGQNINPVPTSGSMLVVFVTPSQPLYLHIPLADVIGTGDMGAIGGRNSYADMPLRVTAKLAPGQSSTTFWLPLDKATTA